MFFNMKIKNIFKIFKRNNSNGKHELSVNYYNGKTFIFTFGSGLRLREAKELTDKLASEGAETNRVGVVIFPKELSERDLNKFRNKYNIQFKQGKYIQERTIDQYRLNSFLS